MATIAEVAFRIKCATVKRRSGDYIGELLAHEQLDRDEVIGLQRVRAASVARFAAERSPYYTRLFESAGVDPSRLMDEREWAKIPVTGRVDMREHESEILTPEGTRRTAEESKTGGSTGEPLRVYRDARVPTLALAWRMYRWWGVEPWDNIARVGRWGFGRVDSIKTSLFWWPTSLVYLDAKYFDPQTMTDFYARMSKAKPALLEGYVGAMVALADFLAEKNLKLPSLRAVATTAAPLTPGVRARLQEVYGVPVYDEYRGSEVNWMAGECAQRDGLHIFADARLIEVLGDDGEPVSPGEEGDIVVTDLTNRVFPIIRYRLGDRGALRDSPCPCGNPLPLMEPVQGRAADLLRFPRGGGVNHGVMAMFAKHPRSVRVFQVYQAPDYSIEVRVVLGDEPDAAKHIEEAVEGLRRQVRGVVPVALRYTDEIISPGGKLKYLISDAR